MTIQIHLDEDTPRKEEARPVFVSTHQFEVPRGTVRNLNIQIHPDGRVEVFSE